MWLVFFVVFQNDVIMAYHLIYEISEWSPAEIIQNLSTEMKNRFCCNFYTINTSIVIFYNSTIGIFDEQTQQSYAYNLISMAAD